MVEVPAHLTPGGPLMERASRVVPTEVGTAGVSPAAGLAQDDQTMALLCNLAFDKVHDALVAPDEKTYVERTLGHLGEYAAVHQAVHLLPLAKVRVERHRSAFQESLVASVEEYFGNEAAESVEQAAAMMARAERLIAQARVLPVGPMEEDDELSRRVNGSILVHCWSADALVVAFQLKRQVASANLLVAISDLRVSARMAAVAAKDLLALRRSAQDAA